MRMPNGYGSVIKLGGKRRKPFAVRITVGYEQRENGTFYQKYKYLEYFEKRKDAFAYLSDYNAGIKMKEHVSLSNVPTFREIYERWVEFKCSLKKRPSEGTVRNYATAYNHMADLHDMKFQNIRLADLQDVVSKYKDMSAGTVKGMMVVLHGMYSYALKHEIVEKDYSQLVTVEFAESEGGAHVPFSEDEVKALWDRQDEPDVFVVLIMIYTGVRMSEFLTLETANFHIEDRYIIGGMKTEAGRDRIIPINDKVVPLIKSHCDTSQKYFYPRKDGRCYSFGSFYNSNWKNLMQSLGMEHKPHDTRHTCATLMESAGVSLLHRKLILGHVIEDITDGVYTHVSTETLIEDINLI